MQLDLTSRQIAILDYALHNQLNAFWDTYKRANTVSSPYTEEQIKKQFADIKELEDMIGKIRHAT